MSLFFVGHSIYAGVHEVQPDMWVLRGDHINNHCGPRQCAKEGEFPNPASGSLVAST